MIQPLLEKKGFNGTLRVYSDYVEIIRHRSLIGFISGLHGDRTLHFNDIDSVYFKKRGIYVGWLGFSMRGEPHRRHFDGVVNNENTVTFERGSDEWEKAYVFVKELWLEYKRSSEQSQKN